MEVKEQLKGTKIWIGEDNPEMSKTVQDILFRRGCTWGKFGASYIATNFPALFIWNDGTITWAVAKTYVENTDFKELTIKDLFKLERNSKDTGLKNNDWSVEGDYHLIKAFKEKLEYEGLVFNSMLPLRENYYKGYIYLRSHTNPGYFTLWGSKKGNHFKLPEQWDEALEYAIERDESKLTFGWYDVQLLTYSPVPKHRYQVEVRIGNTSGSLASINQIIQRIEYCRKTWQFGDLTLIKIDNIDVGHAMSITEDTPVKIGFLEGSYGELLNIQKEGDKLLNN